MSWLTAELRSWLDVQVYRRDLDTNLVFFSTWRKLNVPLSLCRWCRCVSRRIDVVADHETQEAFWKTFHAVWTVNEDGFPQLSIGALVRATPLQGSSGPEVKEESLWRWPKGHRSNLSESTGSRSCHYLHRQSTPWRPWGASWRPPVE